MNMRSCALRTLSAFILSAVTLLLSAQDNSVPEQQLLPVQSLGEVVITANRHGSLGIKTPAAISVTENTSIQKLQLRTTPEALLLAPGVFIQKTNHGGGSPFLRGLTGNQTLLLVDGIRLSNATVRYGPNQYFNTIDLFSIEKIEVLRGSGSVQYGSDAIGGTIQAFTRELENAQDPTWGGTMFSRISTQGMEQTLHGRLSFSARKVAFSGGATWRNFGDLIGGDTTGRQSPTGYRELDFDVKGKILLSASSELTMSFQRVHQRDVPVFHKVVLENYAVNKMDPQKHELAYLRLNQKLNSGIFRSAVFTASIQQNEEGRLLQKNGSSLLRTENDRVHSIAFSAEALTSFGNSWSANSGVEVYNDIVQSRRTDTDLLTDISESKRGLYPDGAKMTSLAIFSMHSFDLQDWIITTGARFNSFVNKVADETVGMTKLTPSAFVGDLSLYRKLTGTSGIFLSLNSGFRAPNIDDLGTLGIVDFRYETPNFNLKPEHSFQYQVGYKFHDQKLSGEIYLYRNELYNLIVRTRMEDLIIEGYPVYQKENVERAYIQGAETAWEKVLSRSWTISGSLTYTYGQNITKDEPVRRIPPLFGRLAAEYKLKSWWINVNWQAAAKQKRLAAGDDEDNRIPAGGTPGWNVFNVSTGYTMRSISFDLSFLNLLNKDYRFHGSGVNGYGRSAFLSVIVTI
jgi:outer membrane cobalamin receptor